LYQGPHVDNRLSQVVVEYISLSWIIPSYCRVNQSVSQNITSYSQNLTIVAVTVKK
jgi:hypothetical protein